jgi:probable F420-dependent oxidoreductase
MSTAHLAWDLNAFSKGRFVLGLGSQVKPHIERRFSMPWSHPAPRMREFVEALRAIWSSWQHGTRLDFHGDFYTHTLMVPLFNPGPNAYGPPKVIIAAVGGLMTRVAAEVADGVMVHPLITAPYLRSVTLPIIDAALFRRGVTRAEFCVKQPIFVVTGSSEEEMSKQDRATRERIAFYASTPAYRHILEFHGWSELQPDLNALAKRGEWAKMGTLIDNDMLEVFAIVAEPQHVASRILERFDGMLDRTNLYAALSDDLNARIAHDIQRG